MPHVHPPAAFSPSPRLQRRSTGLTTGPCPPSAGGPRSSQWSATPPRSSTCSPDCPLVTQGALRLQRCAGQGPGQHEEPAWPELDRESVDTGIATQAAPMHPVHVSRRVVYAFAPAADQGPAGSDRRFRRLFKARKIVGLLDLSQFAISQGATNA